MVLAKIMKAWGLVHAQCRRYIRLAGYGVLMALLAPGWETGSGAQSAQLPAATVGPSGLKIPRFVSLKSDRVNLRQGPGTEYPTSWVFRRAGLPVEVIQEFENWRQIRDAEGTSGWVLGSMLSGRRTALILPWEIKQGQSKRTAATLLDDDSTDARPVARLEAGVLANISSCENKWCRISVGNYRGYIEQVKLWGTYPNETIGN
jgi:SH3-like domain-containing protein